MTDTVGVEGSNRLPELVALADDDALIECMARIIILAKQAGASNRSMAKLFGWSEPTFRRMWNDAVASNDANDLKKASGNNSGDGAVASNDASAALRAV